MESAFGLGWLEQRKRMRGKGFAVVYQGAVIKTDRGPVGGKLCHFLLDF